MIEILLLKIRTSPPDQLAPPQIFPQHRKSDMAVACEFPPSRARLSSTMNFIQRTKKIHRSLSWQAVILLDRPRPNGSFFH
jgi:hypothetical protein